MRPKRTATTAPTRRRSTWSRTDGGRYDILCLEKVFDGDARRLLAKSLARFPHAYGPANDGGLSVKTNSGVWVRSRIPLSGYREIEFEASAGVEMFARKGAMLLSGSADGQRFQLLATHLQGDDSAQYNPPHQRIRNAQMEQIHEQLLAPHADPTVPWILCGDFCTPRLDPDDPFRESDAYASMLRRFGAENGPDYRITLDDSRARNDLAGSSGRVDELDYILLRRNGAPVRATWERHVLRRPGWDPIHGRQDLSYRYAVGARFELGHGGP